MFDSPSSTSLSFFLMSVRDFVTHTYKHTFAVLFHTMGMAVMVVVVVVALSVLFWVPSLQAPYL